MLDFSKIAGNLNRDGVKQRDEVTNPNINNVETTNQEQIQQTQDNIQKNGVEPLAPQSVGTGLSQYFKRLNDGLNKLTGFKGTFSPEQRRKIANVYSNARNKYNLSSKTTEDTTAFNELKNNPIWKTFNNN